LPFIIAITKTKKTKQTGILLSALVLKVHIPSKKYRLIYRRAYIADTKAKSKATARK